MFQSFGFPAPRYQGLPNLVGDRFKYLVATFDVMIGHRQY